MAISRTHTWSAGEVLLASDLNAEFNSILTNAADLVSPFTKAISMGGFALNFDAANTIALTGATNGVSLTGGAFNTAQGADIASAATLNLDTATGNSPDVTGTTTITAVTLSQGRWRLCRFTGALTITNGASLVVEGGADFTTVAGQYVFFVGYASSVVRCIPFTTPAATQTLTNKTITVKDANFTLQDDADTTKQAQLQLSGITAGKTRTLTLPDEDFTVGALARSYLAGLALANNAGDATNDIDVAVGGAVDSTNVYYIALASALTKQLDAVWAVGTNAGMRASGAAIADTTYHIFLIARPDTGVVDIAADTSATGANVAANTNAAYTMKRRIGSIVRTGGSIKAFIQNGDEFVWTGGPVVDVNAANPGTAAVTRTLTLPTGVSVIAIAQIELTSASGTGAVIAYLSDLSTTDVAAAAGIAQCAVTWAGVGNTAHSASEARVQTNTSAQIRSRIQLSDANITILIGTKGWVDRRGRDA